MILIRFIMCAFDRKIKIIDLLTLFVKMICGFETKKVIFLLKGIAECTFRLNFVPFYKNFILHKITFFN